MSRGKLNTAYAVRSFMGFLEGTERSKNTQTNYRSDLNSFLEFLDASRTKLPLSSVTQKDLKEYGLWLKAKGYRSNSQRRKLMTVRKFLRYFHARKKISLDLSQRVLAPYKLERVPKTFDHGKLLKLVQELSKDSPLEMRDRLLLWTLLESGCLVSEVGRIRFMDFMLPQRSGELPTLELGVKERRRVPISEDLFREAQELKRVRPDGASVFPGHNKFGSLGTPVTPRGVELLVKRFAKKNRLGGLTPRVFRHTRVLEWYRSGSAREEIREFLGLKTDYAFRNYEPLFNSAKMTKRKNRKKTGSAISDGKK